MLRLHHGEMNINEVESLRNCVGRVKVRGERVLRTGKVFILLYFFASYIKFV